MHRLRYLVTVGAGKRIYDISYANTTNGTDSVGPWGGDWDKVIAVENGFWASITAMAGERTTSITCEIQLDGKPWQRATSNGTDAYVSCSGIVGWD